MDAQTIIKTIFDMAENLLQMWLFWGLIWSYEDGVSHGCKNKRRDLSPVCTFSQPHTSWRRTVQSDRLFALSWWRKRHGLWHPVAPLPPPLALLGTQSRGSTRPDAERCEMQMEAVPGWWWWGRQGRGNPSPAPPTSPIHRREGVRYCTGDVLLCCKISILPPMFSAETNQYYK